MIVQLRSVFAQLLCMVARLGSVNARLPRILAQLLGMLIDCLQKFAPNPSKLPLSWLIPATKPMAVLRRRSSRLLVSHARRTYKKKPA